MKNLTGQRFGRLHVVGPTGERSWKQIVWECRCDCGKTTRVPGAALRKGTTRSCGCLRNELSAARLLPIISRRGPESPAYKHGHQVDRKISADAHVFRNAKQRCQNPRNPQFELYGGEGKTFEFPDIPTLLAELGPRPSPKHEIDRKDPSKGYVPGNVRWADRCQQAMNKRPHRGCASGFKGVSRNGKGWQASIQARGRVIHGGTFPTALEAAKRYNELAREHHGEFAWLNPVDEEKSA